MASFYHLPQTPTFPADPLSCNDEDIDFFPLWEEEEDQIRRHEAYPFQKLVVDHKWKSEWESEWEDGGGEDEKAELAALLSKQAAHGAAVNPSLLSTRESAVKWLLNSSIRHGFTTQTALLAVSYLDRFLSAATPGGAANQPGVPAGHQQPWMAQLSAVACLSLAAKMEEIRVPLLLDLQVEEARFIFEARTVQRMELLVLSTLGWRLGSPTPLSFIDHFLRRLADNGGHRHAHLRWKFQASCHSILLDLASDHRWVEFLPSELAVATMVHAIGQLLHHPLAAKNLQNLLMNLAGVSKERFEACWEFIAAVAGEDDRRAKRRRPAPASPRGVADVSFSDDFSPPASLPGSVSSSPTAGAAFKRMKSVAAGGQEQDNRRAVLDGVFV